MLLKFVIQHLLNAATGLMTDPTVIGSFEKGGIMRDSEMLILSINLRFPYD